MASRDPVETEMGYGQKLESLGVLAGGIAHDFNNLLVGVLGNADLARSLLPADSPANEALRGIAQSAERAAALCDQLLAYAGRGRLERRPMDLEALLRDMTPLFRAATGGHAKVQVEVSPGLQPIDADDAQIRQVLLNVVTNAAEAIGDNPGIVRIVATNVGPTLGTGRSQLSDVATGAESPPEPRVRVCVIDDGSGMDDVTAARMFEPFFSRKAAGRGLGLPATLGIVRRHGGEIIARSELGVGTTVELRLPASVEQPREVPRIALVDRPEQAGSVLVVDDEPLVQDVVAKMLCRAGYSVVKAEDGEDALRVYREHGPEISLVLLDLTMPTMGGKVALRHLRELSPQLPIVLMSGYDEQRAPAEPDVGPVGFVQKPFRRRTLLDAVAAELSRHAHA